MGLWQYKSELPYRRVLSFTESQSRRLSPIPVLGLTGLPSAFSKRLSWISSRNLAHIQSHLVKQQMSSSSSPKPGTPKLVWALGMSSCLRHCGPTYTGRRQRALTATTGSCEQYGLSISICKMGSGLEESSWYDLGDSVPNRSDSRKPKCIVAQNKIHTGMEAIKV